VLLFAKHISHLTGYSYWRRKLRLLGFTCSGSGAAVAKQSSRLTGYSYWRRKLRLPGPTCSGRGAAVYKSIHSCDWRQLLVAYVSLKH
jgi:hypothetical protein